MKIKSAETEFRQDSSHVAWIQTAAVEDRHKIYDNRWKLYRIFDFRQESRIRQWTWNEPVCQQHRQTLLLSAKTVCWYPSENHSLCSLCRVHFDPLLHVESCWLLQQYIKVPRTLVLKNCNYPSTRKPGQSRTRESSTASLLWWGISSTGFPFVSVSISRSWS